ncbi:unnamed protein product [Knipowitschia caucasica]|uniref:Rab15 effector protein n=1 Tax=Knipowitschia caucasica TaxID=637954 RepID=A0AAV2L1C2_KNICA
MGALGSKPDQFFSSPFKAVPSRSSSQDESTPPHKSIFATLRKPPTAKPNDFIPLFNECISLAATRTLEYLTFKDPENKFSPSPEALTEIFLMTYISESVMHTLTSWFNCTVMTPGQKVLLGADWVWAVLNKPSKDPRIQIAVRVLHLPQREESSHRPSKTDQTFDESMEMAEMAASDKNMCEKMVDFCASIGKDCYALFLFMGRKNDKENIYGVLSNNFQAAIGKCDKIDRGLIENFFKGSRYLHTPTGMMQAIVTKRNNDSLTLLIKFS